MTWTLLLFSFLNIETHAGESSLYDFSWLDKDKEVYVLQNRKFRKDGTFYVGSTFGNQMNGAFIDSQSINVMAGFFFMEEWGIELSYESANGSTNNTYEGVNEQSAVPFYRKVDTATTAYLLWSPFYSKINTFNKIFYFDWILGAGFSSLTTSDNRNQFIAISDRSLTEETNTAYSLMSGARFYINQSWSLRMDVRSYHLNADMVGEDVSSSEDTTEKRWSHFYTFNLGLNYAF